MNRGNRKIVRTSLDHERLSRHCLASKRTHPNKNNWVEEVHGNDQLLAEGDPGTPAGSPGPAEYI